MNNKITFPRLASMLADKSGRTKRFSEDFLREFFSLISESLESGETVKVKGLGTFRLSRVEPRKSVDVTTGEPMEISGHTKVVFVPAKEMAESVNSPFEAFSAVEIGDEIDIDAFEDNEFYNNQSTSSILEIKDETNDKSSASETSDGEDTMVTSETSETENTADSVETSDMPEQSETPEIQENAEDDSYDEDFEPSRRHWLKGFLSGIGAAILVIAIATACWLYFAKPNLSAITKDKFVSQTDKTALPTDDTTTADSIIPDTTETETKTTDKEVIAMKNEPKAAASEAVPTAPSDKVVYDTIGKTRYLTTMAKAHYGNYNLWPYIYEENKAFLRHPDRIRPGTPVVVPKLSKYGVDPTNPKDLEAAKKLGIEIYARYKKD